MAKFGGGIIDAMDDMILANVAVQALNMVFAEASGSLNAGQDVMVDWYVKPAMEDGILGDPEGFDAGTLYDDGVNAHWAAEQALSETISSAAEAAQDARDAIQDALDVAGILL